ncbi:hypothetical protein FB446DRAFT_704217 [Lentinula raphanica]|nr:hypothetical protein FB446DRAFT_704217 [Lentinula raphanica]
MYPLGVAIRDFVLLLGVVCAVFATALPLSSSAIQVPIEAIRVPVERIQVPIETMSCFAYPKSSSSSNFPGLIQEFNIQPWISREGWLNLTITCYEWYPLSLTMDGGVRAELVALEETGSERSIEDGWYARNGPVPVLQFIASGFMRQEAEITWRWNPPISYAGSKIKLGSDGLLKCYDVPGRDREPSHVISRGPPAWSPVSLHDVFHQPAPNTGVGVDVVSTLTNVEKNKGVPLLSLAYTSPIQLCQLFSHWQTNILAIQLHINAKAYVGDIVDVEFCVVAIGKGREAKA